MAMAGAQATGLASLGLASIIIGRSLGPSGYGTFAVALSLQAFLAVLSSIGLRNGIAYEVATGRWSPGSALRHALLAGLVLGGVGGLAGIAAYALAGDSLFPGVSAAAALLLFGGTPLGVALLLLIGATTALERYEAAGLLLAAPSVGIALLASAVAISSGVSEVVAAIGGATIAVGLCAAGWALGLASDLGQGQHPGAARGHLGEAARFGARTWAADVLSLINLRGDLILVGALAASQETGLYAVAATLTTLGLVIPEALAQVLLPRVASLDRRPSRGDEGASITVGRAGRHATVIAAATSVALLAAVLLVPVVYGSSFEGSVKLGLILIPGVAALGASRVLAYALAGLGEPGLVLRISAAVALPSVAIYVVVISAAGATGAAIVSTASYTVTFVLTVVAVSRRSGVGGAALILPRRSDLSAYREMPAAVADYLRARRAPRTASSAKD